MGIKLIVDAWGMVPLAFEYRSSAKGVVMSKKLSVALSEANFVPLGETRGDPSTFYYDRGGVIVHDESGRPWFSRNCDLVNQKGVNLLKDYYLDPLDLQMIVA